MDKAACETCPTCGRNGRHREDHWLEILEFLATTWDDPVPVHLRPEMRVMAGIGLIRFVEECDPYWVVTAKGRQLLSRLRKQHAPAQEGDGE